MHNYHDVQQLEARNEALLNQAEQQAQEQQAQQHVVDGTDNRGRLNNYWMQQDLKRSKNVVSELGSNFDGVNDVTATPPAKGKEVFNPGWLDQNSLRPTGSGQKPAEGQPGDKPQDFGGKDGGRGRFFRGEGKPMSGDESQPQPGMKGSGQGGQKAPDIATKEQRDLIQQQLQEVEQSKKSGQAEAGEQVEKLQRYQQRLDQETREQLRQPQADSFSSPNQGQFGGAQSFDSQAIPGGGGDSPAKAAATWA